MTCPTASRVRRPRRKPRQKYWPITSDLIELVQNIASAHRIADALENFLLGSCSLTQFTSVLRRMGMAKVQEVLMICSEPVAQKYGPKARCQQRRKLPPCSSERASLASQ